MAPEGAGRPAGSIGSLLGGLGIVGVIVAAAAYEADWKGDLRPLAVASVVMVAMGLAVGPRPRATVRSAVIAIVAVLLVCFALAVIGILATHQAPSA